MCVCVCVCVCLCVCVCVTVFRHRLEVLRKRQVCVCVCVCICMCVCVCVYVCVCMCVCLYLHQLPVLRVIDACYSESNRLLHCCDTAEVPSLQNREALPINNSVTKALQQCNKNVTSVITV
jgi:hypothetical protein